MNATELQVIQARADAATQGTWLDFEGIVDGIRPGYGIKSGALVILFTAYINDRADIDFISHARQDVPELLAEVARLESNLRDCERLLDVEQQSNMRLQGEVERLRAALTELLHANKLRGDYETYLYDVGRWGLGEMAEHPRMEDFQP